MSERVFIHNNAVVFESVEGHLGFLIPHRVGGEALCINPRQNYDTIRGSDDIEMPVEEFMDIIKLVIKIKREEANGT